MTIIIIFLILNLLNLTLFDWYSRKIILIDEPNEERKIHSKSVSKIGGFLFLLNFILILIFSYLFDLEDNSSFLYSLSDYLSIFLGGILFFYLGYYDDKFYINAFRRLIFSSLILVGLLLIDNDLNITYLNFSFIEEQIYTERFSIYFTVLCILLFLNAFNMFDGINLQSGIYFIFILSVIIFKNFLIILPIIFIFCSIVFLYLNYRQRLFLGNNGSMLIAFIISFLLIKAHNESYLFADEIFLIMLVPGIDMLRLFTSRLLNGKSPFKADNFHLHHIILNNHSLIKTNLIIQSLIILPYILSLLSGMIILSILVTLILYSFVFFLYGKNTFN